MKKSRNIILCIALFVIIVIIVIYLVIPQKKNEVIKNEINNEVYYTVTYSTNYDGADVIYNEEYEVVQEKKRLNEILKKVQAQSDDIFDDVFFTNHSILIVEAGINPEFNKCEITDTKADIVIYHATPLTTTEDIWDFNLYLIPVNKNIEDIQVEVATYPGRFY